MLVDLALTHLYRIELHLIWGWAFVSYCLYILEILKRALLLVAKFWKKLGLDRKWSTTSETNLSFLRESGQGSSLICIVSDYKKTPLNQLGKGNDRGRSEDLLMNIIKWWQGVLNPILELEHLGYTLISQEVKTTNTTPNRRINIERTCTGYPFCCSLGILA